MLKCPKCYGDQVLYIGHSCWRCKNTLMVCRNCIGFRFCEKEGRCNMN